MLLCGPPGCGKTTIASVVAHQTSRRFVEPSATSAGVAEVRKVLAAAQKELDVDGTRTLVFHRRDPTSPRLSRMLLLPAVEAGFISLIGATTENPSFSVNAALVSRSILMVLKPISAADIVKLLARAPNEDPDLDGHVSAESPVLQTDREPVRRRRAPGAEPP
ncbi:AAA family ATPase [Streptomyces chartreusis]|uniref:AAA family ATPase n=1 Tax=Streptomyces chartreusis TaxID=1969 RepID=UPI00368E3E8A